tara:strand:- start:122 stop:811 length:690 start_codon:yes stop_codon:yes gene_type:complete
MKIDVRDVKCRWINLDSATESAKRMEKLLGSLGIKDHERLSARILPCPEGTRPSEKHYVGVGQSHIDCLKSVEGNLPALILEDDIALSKVGETFFNSKDHPPILEIPDDTDAIYLGISHGDGNYVAEDIGDGFARISRMLAAHAILYVSERYAKEVQHVAHRCIYEAHKPFDVGTYMIQEHFNIITPYKPFFYQKSYDEKEALNDWEQLTRTPLMIKPSTEVPIGPKGM